MNDQIMERVEELAAWEPNTLVAYQTVLMEQILGRLNFFLEVGIPISGGHINVEGGHVDVSGSYVNVSGEVEVSNYYGCG